MKKEIIPVTTNRKAKHDYQIMETFELGIILKGSEVKSIREGSIQLSESYVTIINNELFLVNAYIDQYSNVATYAEHDKTRNRKLLANKSEIKKMTEATNLSGHTLIPLKGYFSGNKFKIEVAICKGKDNRDKREDKKKKEDNREMDRAMKESMNK